MTEPLSCYKSSLLLGLLGLLPRSPTYLRSVQTSNKPFCNIRSTQALAKWLSDQVPLRHKSCTWSSCLPEWGRTAMTGGNRLVHCFKSFSPPCTQGHAPSSCSGLCSASCSLFALVVFFCCLSLIDLFDFFCNSDARYYRHVPCLA